MMPKSRRDTIVEQVRIANSAMVELMMHGEISQGVRDIAREFGISDARLGAMVLFLQTKGPPRQ